MKKLLSILLFLSGLMPLFLGTMCLAAYPKALEMIKLTDSPDVFQAVSLFGICLLSLGVLQLLAGAWVWQGKSAGITLARLCGVMILLDGILIYTVIHRPDLGLPDIIKGGVLSVLAFIAKSDK